MARRSSTRQRDYSRVGRWYEWLGARRSDRLPPRTAVQLQWLAPGSRVLYIGAGPAVDAQAAASRGCGVTCIDLSASVLQRAKARFERAGFTGEFIVGDIAESQPAAPYDMIVANFVFNIFEPTVAVEMLGQANDWLAPEGVLLLADFARPEGRLGRRIVPTLNYRVAIGIYTLIGLARWRSMHDYLALCEQAVLRAIEQRIYSLTRWLGPMYPMICARPGES